MTLMILRTFPGGPAREVPLCESRLAALLATNDAEFADAAALLRHLRRGRTVRMMLAEYRLRPEDQFRIVSEEGRLSQEAVAC